MSEPTDPPVDVLELVEQLSQAQPMRRGSLSARSMKCSKPGCACAQDPAARHGPYYSLTRTVAGQTRSRYLSREQAEQATGQIEAGQAFRRRIEAYWQACEGWADQVLEGVAAVQSEGRQKKGSRRSSRPRSRPKSRR